MMANEEKAVPCLRWLVAGLSLRWPGFALGSVCVGFLVGKVELGHIFLRVLRFYLSITFYRGSPYSYIIRGINNRPAVQRLKCHPIDINNSNKGR
jgi:hypothetical protein